MDRLDVSGMLVDLHRGVMHFMWFDLEKVTFSITEPNTVMTLNDMSIIIVNTFVQQSELGRDI